jgi:hypothetical protein
VKVGGDPDDLTGGGGAREAQQDDDHFFPFLMGFLVGSYVST